MGLLNYTTQVGVLKTLSEIQSMLSRAGANVILTEYDAAKNVVAISFKIQTRFGIIPYRLPCDIQRIQQTLNIQVRSREIPKKFLNDAEQAARVGWRIIKNWLEAQLAIVETDMVTLDQVFLPYAQSISGKTLYDQMVETQFGALLIEG